LYGLQPLLATPEEKLIKIELSAMRLKIQNQSPEEPGGAVSENKERPQRVQQPVLMAIRAILMGIR